jgi:hypothetical protein
MRVKRDARALEEAIATGMVQSKGLGKKKRAEQGEALQRTAWQSAARAQTFASPPCPCRLRTLPTTPSCCPFIAAAAAKNRDRGLMEAGPSFKNGVLRVKPLHKQRAESGKLRLPKGVL